jgi:hypothetical protein
MGIYKCMAVHYKNQTNTYKLVESYNLDSVVETSDNPSDKWHVFEMDRVKEFSYQVVCGHKPPKKYNVKSHRIYRSVASEIPIYAQFFQHKLVIKQKAIWTVHSEFALPFVVKDINILLFLIEQLKLIPNFTRSHFTAYQYDSALRSIYVTPFTT